MYKIITIESDTDKNIVVKEYIDKSIVFEYDNDEFPISKNQLLVFLKNENYVSKRIHSKAVLSEYHAHRYIHLRKEEDNLIVQVYEGNKQLIMTDCDLIEFTFMVKREIGKDSVSEQISTNDYKVESLVAEEPGLFKRMINALFC